MKTLDKIFAIAILCLVGWSCTKDLDLAPEDVLSEESFFLNAEDFKLFAADFYYNLPASGEGLRDRQSDIGYNEGGNDISRGTHLAPQQSDFWNGSYSNIRSYNFLLEKIDMAEEALQSDIAVYKGEALFFRAYTYFSLLKAYGGVPIVEIPLDTDSEELYASRDTREEVVNFIIGDVDEAIDLLPESNQGTNIGRLTKYAALALKARVALFEGTWRKFHSAGDFNALLDQAVDAANQVMNSGNYELFDRRDVFGDESYRFYFVLDSDGRTNPVGLTKADDKESILRTPQNRDIRPTPWEGDDGFPVWDVRMQNPTKAMMDLFLCEDGLPIDKSPLFMGYDSTHHEYLNRDIRMRTMMYVPDNRYWSFRFAEWWRVWDDPSVNGFIYMEDGSYWGGRTATGYNGQKFTPEVEIPLGTEFPVFRLAEVLLIYAEAVFEKSESISDADLNRSINLLRNRVGLPDLSNGFVSSNGLNMREEIRRERTVELSYEGFRYDDLRRWKTAEIELPKPVKGVKYTGTQWETDPRYSDNVFQTDQEGFIIIEDNRVFDPNKHYLLPLPIRQLIINPNLKQNPGWPEQ